MSAVRAVPFYCPFCGEEALRPSGQVGDEGAWRCESCDRGFRLTEITVGREQR